jgi:Ca-activated chloride channel homolog
MAPEVNLYEILGLERDASPEQVRRAYREMARRLHPDVNKAVGDTEFFIEAQRAYETLADPEKRTRYDASLGETADLISSVLFSRQVIPRLNEPQLVYALLKIQPPRRDPQTPPPEPPLLNLAVVIDRSTSMQGVRMDMVKAGVIELVRRLRPRDILTLVAFSDRAETLRSASPVQDRREIETSVRMLRTGGGTEILRGLQAGMLELRRHLNKNYVNHLILITDGRTYGDSEECLKLAQWAASAGISISGLGIGSEWNDEFLDELSTLSGGGSAFVSRPSDIHLHLKDRLLGLARTYAEQLRLELTLPPDVTLRDAFRLAPEAARLPVTGSLPMGSLTVDSPVSCLLEFQIGARPSAADRLKLLWGSLRYHLLPSPAEAGALALDYSLPLRESPDLEYPPKAVVLAVARVTFYRMQEKARQEASQGEFDKAASRLQNLATHLLKQGNPDLAQTVLREADRLKRTRAFSEEGEKRVKYGTRAFLLPPHSSEFRK